MCDCCGGHGGGHHHHHHDHEHGHGHAHGHTHSHDHEHPHVHGLDSLQPPDQTPVFTVIEPAQTKKEA